MQILLLSDIHGSINYLKRLAQKISKADLVLLAGDMTHFGERDKIERIIDWIQKKNTNILAVPGNCDTFEVDGYLSEKQISLHGEVREFKGYHFIGMGGALPCPGSTPFEFTEKEFETVLTKSFASLESTLPSILVTHQPPFQTVADEVSINYHVGSKSIRRLIDTYQPLLSVCGHIHESKGKGKIGNTWIVNPGPLRNGNFAIIDLNEKINSIELHKLLGVL